MDINKMIKNQLTGRYIKYGSPYYRTLLHKQLLTGETRFSPRDLRRFRHIQVGGDDDYDNCPICLQVPRDLCVTLHPCGHTLCENCCVELCRTSTCRCPQCRRPITGPSALLSKVGRTAWLRIDIPVEVKRNPKLTSRLRNLYIGASEEYKYAFVKMRTQEVVYNDHVAERIREYLGEPEPGRRDPPVGSFYIRSQDTPEPDKDVDIRTRSNFKFIVTLVFNDRFEKVVLGAVRDVIAGARSDGGVLYKHKPEGGGGALWILKAA